MLTRTLFAAVILLVSVARGHAASEWSLDDHLARMERADAFRVEMPDGARGPVPVIVLFPGCAGEVGVESVYSAKARSMGVAAMIVDSLTFRHLDSHFAKRQLSCKALLNRGATRAADALAAVAVIRKDPRLDASRIIFVGFSHGAWMLFDLLSMDLVETLPPGLSDAGPGLEGVQGVFMQYPLCSWPARLGPVVARGDGLGQPIPAHVTLVGQDLITPSQKCSRIVATLRERGAKLTCTWFEEVHHAFDDPVHRGKTTGRVRFEPKRAEQAVAGFGAFLSERLGLAEGPADRPLPDDCPR